MSVPAFNSTTHSTFTQSPNPSWTYGEKVDTTPVGKDWLAGESAGWKVYNTAELDEAYVLLDLLLSRYRDRNRQQYAQTLEFGHRTAPHRICVHNQRGGYREPGTIQVIHTSVV
jgi:hypothetical protein